MSRKLLIGKTIRALAVLLVHITAVGVALAKTDTSGKWRYTRGDDGVTIKRRVNTPKCAHTQLNHWRIKSYRIYKLPSILYV